MWKDRREQSCLEKLPRKFQALTLGDFERVVGFFVAFSRLRRSSQRKEPVAPENHALHTDLGDQRWPRTRTPSNTAGNPPANLPASRPALGTTAPRRVPRLQQIMIDARFVDSLDRRIRIGIRCQQYALRFRIDWRAPYSEIRHTHFRHALGRQQ